MKNAAIEKMSIKCDHCDWSKEIASLTQINIGAKCPKCNEVVFTQQDFDMATSFMGLMAAANTIELESSETDPRIEGSFNTRTGLNDLKVTK